MRWEPLAKASENLKYNKSALRSKARRGNWPRQEGPDGGWLYAVPETESEANTIKVTRYAGGSIIEEIVEEQEEDNNIDSTFEFKIFEPEHRLYYYDEGRDQYVFNLPSKSRHPWVVPGKKVRDLISAYSKQGDDATVNQAARMFGWTPKTVMETLKCLGKTHNSLPFTSEHIAASTDEDLVEDLVRRREERVNIIAERKNWQRIKALAERAQNWERFITECMSQTKIGAPPPVPKWKTNNGENRKTDNSQPFTLVSHATDLHYGKEGWVDQTGEEFTRDICEQRLTSATVTLIERAERWGRPNEVIIGAGGDWFHVDNHHGTTTRGTPQDTDGNFLRIFKEGCELARNHIEVWRNFVPKVSVKIVRGNHDYYSTALLGMWLQATYADSPDVDIGRSEIDREYTQIGQTILGLTHGDATKDKDLGALMAYEAKHLWSDTRYRLWLTGHWHSQISYEQHGVLVEHLPSLAGTDAWHNQHGYVGNRKALMAHLIDHEYGPIAKILADC